MSLPGEVIDCVAFMLVSGNRILVEMRSASKVVLPNALAIPGGHVDAGETLEAALVREIREELGVDPGGFTFVCTLLHESDEVRRIHYYAISQWTGEIVAHEAESLRWLPLDELHALDLDIDVTAVEHYLAAA